jgi:hypothetical protein
LTAAGVPRASPAKKVAEWGADECLNFGEFLDAPADAVEEACERVQGRVADSRTRRGEMLTRRLL